MKFIFCFSIFVLFGCMSLPMVNSVKEQPEGKYEYSYYNNQHQILYKVTNDDSNLHVILNTSSAASILKVLKTGLTIYFDVTGKKRHDVFVHYPYKMTSDLQKETYTKDIKAEPSARSLNYYVSLIPAELIYSAYAKNEAIHLHNTNSGITDSITVIKDNEIIYELCIPLNRITMNGKYPLTNLSIGIVSGQFDLPNKNELPSTRTGVSTGNNAGGMVTNAPTGGGMVNQAANDVPNSAATDYNPDLANMAIPIEFWFKVNLFKN